MSDASASVRRIRWSTAAGVAGVGGLSMVLLGAVIVPYGRFFVRAIYGMVEEIALAPFGLAFPGGVGFVLANTVTLAFALAAGRRVGAFQAYQAVSGQLGSHRLLVASACLAGIAGAAAFVAAAPSTTLSTPGGPWPYRAGDALFGYVLYVAALAVGPALGVSRYLRAHPYCRSCLVWLQRESSGGFFAPHDARRLRAALSADAYGELRDLPVEERSPPGRSYRLQWWDCPSCHREAYVRCLPADGEDTGPAMLSRRVVGPPVDELRSLVAHRHRLHQQLPVRRQGSQA